MKRIYAAVVIWAMTVLSSWSEDAAWQFRDKTVSGLIADCPASFGSSPILPGTPEYSAGISCFTTFMSAIDYFDATKESCFKGADRTVQDMKKAYTVFLRTIKKTSIADPAANLQDTLEGPLRKFTRCK